MHSLGTAIMQQQRSLIAPHVRTCASRCRGSAGLLARSFAVLAPHAVNAPTHQWSYTTKASLCTADGPTVIGYAASTAAACHPKLSSRLSAVVAGTAAGRLNTPPSSSGNRRTRKASQIEQWPDAARGDFTACMQLLQQLAVAPGARTSSFNAGTTGNNSDDYTMKQMAINERVIAFERRRKPNDLWLLTTSGRWIMHEQGWTGPAMALLQAWPLPGNHVGVAIHDYCLYRISPDGLPDPDATYVSATSVEKMSDRRGFQAWNKSFMVARSVQDANGIKLARWIAGRAVANQRMRFISKNPHAKINKIGQDPIVSIMSSCSSSNNSKVKPPALADHGQRNSKQLLHSSINKSAAWQELAAQSAKAAAVAAATGHAQYSHPEQPCPHSPELSMATAVIQSRQNILNNIKQGREDLADMHIPLTDLQLYQCQQQKSDAGQQLEQVYSLEALEQQAAAAWEYSSRGQAVPSELMPEVPDASCPFTITMTNGLDGQQYVVAHYEPAALLRQRHRAAAILADIFHGRRNEVRMSRASAPKSERMVMAGLRIPRRSNKYVHYGRYIGDEGLAPDMFSDIAYSALKNAGAMPAVCDYLGEKVLRQVWQINLDAANQVQAAMLQAAAKSVGQLTQEQQQQQQQQQQQLDAGTSSANEGHKQTPQRFATVFPAPFLSGSVFTTLAVTQNYLSSLHAEPQEHPFNFIVWADLLLEGQSVMKVGHFWLTAGLAFVPQNGSGLYIDVRLVTHRSEPSIVSNNSSLKTAGLEGRYGCALFIKPPVLRRNALEWAKLDWTLAHSWEASGQQLQALAVEQVMHTAVEYEEADEEE